MKNETNQETYYTVFNYVNNVVVSYFFCENIEEAREKATFTQGADITDVRESIAIGTYTVVNRYYDGKYERQSVYVK